LGAQNLQKMHLRLGLRPRRCRLLAKSFRGQKRREEVGREKKKKGKRNIKKKREGFLCDLGRLLFGADGNEVYSTVILYMSPQ